MRVVIHAGMHKTGSSAVQQHFFTHPARDVVYAPWNEGNHCGLFILLFQDADKLAQYHGFLGRGPDFLAGLPAMRDRWMASVEQALDATGNRTFVLSAEDISLPIYRSAVERMRTFLRRWTDRIEVVGYVRSPRSFAVSVFQQLVKDGLNQLDPQALWPHYRGRFEPLEEVFGRENVTLRAYDRHRLVNGDIVSDFASVLGLPLPAAAEPDVNATLSAEATALLFAQRKMGDGLNRTQAWAQHGNRAFIDRLQAIGGARFDLAEALWRPVLDRNAAELAWVESRLGFALTDAPRDGAVMIGSEDDLLRLAADSYPLIERAVFDAVRNGDPDPLRRTVRAVELLRKISY